MAKINVTNHQMLMMEQEFQQLNGTLIGIFLSSKMRQFISDNGIRFETIHDKRKMVIDKFCLMENGKPKMTEAVEGKQSEPILNDGLTKEDFEKEMNNLLQEINTLEI